MKATATMMYVCTRDISIHHTIHTILVIQILKYLIKTTMLSRESVKQDGR
jgi:hypothetical protein